MVAVGGNAIAGQGADLDDVIASVATELCGMAADGWRIVVVHGSGPQVGRSLRRSELASHEVSPLPMDLATAETQGSLGVLLQRAVGERLRGRRSGGSATVISQVLVDPADSAMSRATKPIGQTMDEGHAHALAERHGWAIACTDAGWRRVVPSPEPREVVELEALLALLDTGQIVIACGGGGVPVLREPSGRLLGVEAVIDKDLTASLLARRLEAHALVIGTTVANVGIDLGTPDQRWLGRVNADELRVHLAAGQFPPGSMGPKIEAVLAYLDAGGRHTAVCDIRGLGAGLAGTAGTVVSR